MTGDKTRRAQEPSLYLDEIHLCFSGAALECPQDQHVAFPPHCFLREIHLGITWGWLSLQGRRNSFVARGAGRGGGSTGSHLAFPRDTRGSMGPEGNSRFFTA